MCVVCGCQQTVRPDGSNASVKANRANGSNGENTKNTENTENEALDGSPVVDSVTGDLHYGRRPSGVSVPGLDEPRTLKIEADVLGENARHAARNRAHLAAHGVRAFDLVSSPGSGKTSLLCATISWLASHRPDMPVAVIEGDQQTSLDADRIRGTGAQAIQVNTGKGCHLDARMVGDAFSRLHLHAHAHTPPRAHGYEHPHQHPHRHRHGPDHALESEQAFVNDTNTLQDTDDIEPTLRRDPGALLLIENVGNLVCPALWDLGEQAKVVVLSVTEGDDKPLKYPDMFAACTLMLINKIDLLPHVDFDVSRCIAAAQHINPTLQVLQTSATGGKGIDAFARWLLQSAGNPSE